MEVNGTSHCLFVEKQQWGNDNSKIITFKNSSEQLVEQSIGKNVFSTFYLKTFREINFIITKSLGMKSEKKMANLAGNIVEINDQTVQHYFILKLADKEIIIPIIKGWILEVNRKKFIKMQLPEGLMDVFLTPTKNDETIKLFFSKLIFKTVKISALHQNYAKISYFC